jgi:hypothetical protein
MTDADRRAAGCNVIAPTFEPTVDFGEFQIAALVRSGRPTGKQSDLNFEVLPAQAPIRRSMDGRVTQRSKACDCLESCCRPQRRSESFVPALVAVHGRDNAGVYKVRWFEHYPTVISKRCVYQQAARSDLRR